MLQGKTGLVVGVANKRSIAWAIARALHAQGMRLALTYQGERFEGEVRALGDTLPGTTYLPLDVQDDAQVRGAADTVRGVLGGLDCLVHSIAFAKREELGGRFLDTSRDGYRVAQEVSAYSLTALARACSPLMEGREASIITLTYLGGERVVPNYNVMGVAKAALDASVRYLAADLGPQGIRVNAISAGPIRTLSASGVSGLRDLMEVMGERAPLRRNVDQEDVAGAAVFLASPLSRGVTGEVIHVDAGYHVLGF
ncbi:MAG: enoyl-ACP reductase [Planctomycetes bacterium]|nr:enoyl-ACP reductase [Planctomycetota bacterium]